MLSLFSCDVGTEKSEPLSGSFLPYHQPNNYLCLKTTDIVIDGVLNDEEWRIAEWTDLFKDIQGDDLPLPRHNTRAKMAWNDDYLFIAAEIEEPHVWASITERDEVIFYDNDFEVFIDPDGDTHNYYELEINAFETAWDLLLTMPYRDFGFAIDSWDINGLKVGVSVQGTINDPTDIDEGWTIEIAIPFKVLEECSSFEQRPSSGDVWRINFSRVEWKTVIEEGQYVKEINPETEKVFPEDNWVWSPQYNINMHMPEYWGYLEFSDKSASDKESLWIIPPDEITKWYLRNVYYLQSLHKDSTNKYAANLSELSWPETFEGIEIPLPDLQMHWNGYIAALPSNTGQGFWQINQSGLINKVEKLNE